MLKQQLTLLGLGDAQSEVLLFLLENKAKKAREIATKTGLARGLAYKALEELIELGLVEKDEKKGKIALFSACHPSKIEALLEKEEKQISQKKVLLREILPNLLSGYNLSLNKPAVQFYEGKEAIEKILFDTLEEKDDVFLLINRTALAGEKNFKKINEKYKKRRIKAGISKKILRIGKCPAFPLAQNQKYASLTEIRYLEKTAFPFKTALHIYGNKISFLIIEKNAVVGILIQDKNIFQLNKFWFEALWENAKIPPKQEDSLA